MVLCSLNSDLKKNSEIDSRSKVRVALKCYFFSRNTSRNIFMHFAEKFIGWNVQTTHTGNSLHRGCFTTAFCPEQKIHILSQKAHWVVFVTESRSAFFTKLNEDFKADPHQNAKFQPFVLPGPRPNATQRRRLLCVIMTQV